MKNILKKVADVDMENIETDVDEPSLLDRFSHFLHIAVINDEKHKQQTPSRACKSLTIIALPFCMVERIKIMMTI